MRHRVEDTLTPITCRHGGRAGRMPDGRLWCPQCRLAEEAAAAQEAARDEAHRAHLERLKRLGWRNGRPPLDHKMRAAGERSEDD